MQERKRESCSAFNWKQHSKELHERIGRESMDIAPWSIEDIRFLSLALCGEAGELANVVKKEWRGDQRSFQSKWIISRISRLINRIAKKRSDVFTSKSTAIKELADVRIYTELLARAFEIDLDAVCATKLEEVKLRWKDKFEKAYKDELSR